MKKEKQVQQQLLYSHSRAHSEVAALVTERKIIVGQLCSGCAVSKQKASKPTLVPFVNDSMMKLTCSKFKKCHKRTGALKMP